MAGTLESMVNYDAVVFQKAWDFLASSDDEDNIFYLFIYLFFRGIIFPGKGAKYGLFGGDYFFCSRWPMQGNELRKKKKRASTKKTSKISKKSSPRASDTGKGSYKHNAPDLWDRGSISIYSIDCVCVCGVSVCVSVFSSHSFWTSRSLDVPAGVIQEEGHTRFLIHLLSAVHVLIFLASRIMPLLSLVDREVEFCVY